MTDNKKGKAKIGVNRKHATKEEIQLRKRIATQIYNEHRGDLNYTREDIIGLIQKEINLPRWATSKLVLGLGFYEKRKSTPYIPSNNPNTRICPKCGEEKDLNQFPKKGKDRQGNTRYSYCHNCHAKYQRILQLKRFYGLSVDENDLLGNVCHICGRKGKTKAVSIDHDHKTGLIRGKLCSRCNRGLAWFLDNPELLRKCAEYLEMPPAPKILGKEVYGRAGRVTKRRGKKKKYATPEPIYHLDNEQ